MAFQASYRTGTRRAVLTGLLALCAAAGTANADNFWSSTVLAGAEVSQNSERVSGISWQSYTLSDGSQHSLRPWYSSGREDLHLTMLTAVNSGFGVLWGFGTGEQGVQYEIEPSLRLGFISTREFSPNRSLSLRVQGVIGGYLTERPCTADYGAIGGAQSVNCRMSGSVMRPADTLDYLLDEPPADQVEASLTYKIRF